MGWCWQTGSNFALIAVRATIGHEGNRTRRIVTLEGTFALFLCFIKRYTLNSSWWCVTDHIGSTLLLLLPSHARTPMRRWLWTALRTAVVTAYFIVWMVCDRVRQLLVYARRSLRLLDLFDQRQNRLRSTSWFGHSYYCCLVELKRSIFFILLRIQINWVFRRGSGWVPLW